MRSIISEIEKLEYEKSLSLRNFEIDNFWKRGYFFGALLVALITGYIVLTNSEAGSNKDYCIYISFIGFFVSLAQTLMNRGSKYWQERYEFKTKNLESNLKIDVTKMSRYDGNEKYYLDSCILDKEQENILTRSARFSVTKLTFLVWDVITISWLLIWIKDCKLKYSFWCYNEIVVFHVTIILYTICFFINGSVYQPFTKTKNAVSKKEYLKDSEKYIQDKL
jgi:hypothetical protein